MPSSSWNLQRDRAQLRKGNLSAEIDLRCPGRGLTRVALPNPLPNAGLLALAAPASHGDAGRPASDWFVRDTDLVAVYEETENWPVRMDVVWRATNRPDALAAVDLVVSVRTSRLDSRPELDVCSFLPAEEVLWVSGTEPQQARPLDLQVAQPESIGPSDPAGCVLVRLAGTDLSYVEIVHPADSRQTVVQCDDRASVARVSHKLFAESLEKGVILRGRIRGLFVRRPEDVRRAAREYLVLAAEEPPLGL